MHIPINRVEAREALNYSWIFTKRAKSADYNIHHNTTSKVKEKTKNMFFYVAGISNWKQRSREVVHVQMNR